MHGDLYAHNTLVDNEGNTLLSDFGAASFYDTKDVAVADALERIEVCAFGHMLDDLLSLCNEAEDNPSIVKLRGLRNAATAPDASSRPSFESLNRELEAMIGHKVKV